METYTNNEGIVNDEVKDPDHSPAENTESINPDHPVRNTIHSSAMYAASKWHSSVKHVKPPHAGGSFLPLQA